MALRLSSCADGARDHNPPWPIHEGSPSDVHVRRHRAHAGDYVPHPFLPIARSMARTLWADLARLAAASFPRR